MIHASLAVMRLSLLRLWRSRTRWLVLLVLALPPFVAAGILLQPLADLARWRMIAELSVGLLATLGPAVFLAPAYGEELDGKTLTYLWTRPMPRGALLWGKLLAVTPWLAGGLALSVAGAFALLGGGVPVESLLRVCAALVLGVVASSAVAIAFAVLTPKHPFVVLLGYLLVLEQLISRAPLVAHLSVVRHMRILAGPPVVAPGIEEPLQGALGLVVLTAAWTALAFWRVRRAELRLGEG